MGQSAPRIETITIPIRTEDRFGPQIQRLKDGLETFGNVAQAAGLSLDVLTDQDRTGQDTQQDTET